jgi:RNA polymerase sigma-70 factor, ECF subfamily
VTLEYVRPSAPAGIPERPADPALNAHYLTILRFCMRQLGDRSDAEDATQETFRRALQQRDVVVGDPLPWLIAVARNICIDELRRRRSGQGVLERSAAVTTATRADDESAENPERVVVGRMFVNELLGQLTPAERRVVAGTIADGRCGGDLAASLGVTTSTARVLLARARQKLRRYLEDGQTTVTGVCFAGWRGADWVRHRVLGGRAALLPRAELLLPALVVTAIATAAGAPPVAGRGASGAASGGTHALGALRADAGSDGVGRGYPPAGGVTAHAWSGETAARGGPLATPPLAQSHYDSPTIPLFPAPDPNEVGVTDFAASPNYSSDHTIYMVGMGNNWNEQLFRSADGGATWTFVPTQGLQSSQLLLPAASFNSGRVYGGGGTFVQVSTNWGGNFQNDGPVTGYLAIAPAWLGVDVVESGEALTFLSSAQVPRVAAVFPLGDTAVGVPVLLSSPDGFTALQLVQNNVVGDGSDALLRCGPAGCVTVTQLPISGGAQLLASPQFATDHLLVAIGNGVAVSHDGGTSFTLVSTRPESDATIVAGSHGPRLVALDATSATHNDLAVVFSDDWGLSWSSAISSSSAGQALDAHTLRSVAPGRLIAAAIDASRPGQHAFVCSSDGALWSACT